MENESKDQKKESTSYFASIGNGISYVVGGVGYYTGLDRFFVANDEKKSVRQEKTAPGSSIPMLPLDEKNRLKSEEKKPEVIVKSSTDIFFELTRRILNTREDRAIADFWNDQVRGFPISVEYTDGEGKFICRNAPDGIREMITQLEANKVNDNKSNKPVLEFLQQKAHEAFERKSCLLSCFFEKPLCRKDATHDLYRIFHHLEMKNIEPSLKALTDWKKTYQSAL